MAHLVDDGGELHFPVRSTGAETWAAKLEADSPFFRQTGSKKGSRADLSIVSNDRLIEPSEHIRTHSNVLRRERQSRAVQPA